ncbi:MAG: hypothetical protein SF187_21610 [Deltaproteobacteria bacterium]|nr:hypothetical protein [Deltaproteobacteria bacterium]
MIARIESHKVGLCRGPKDAPIRTLDLSVACEADPGVRKVFLRFYERKQDTLGFINAVKDNVIVFLPLDDFALTRDLLDGPEDVFVAWIANQEGTLVWAELTTADTPLRAHHLPEANILHLVAPEERNERNERNDEVLAGQ